MKTPKLIVSTVPHIHCGNSVQKIMINILIALIPAVIFGVIFFGTGIIKVIIIAMLSAAVWETLLQKMMGRDVAIKDLSGITSGLIFAMLLPPLAPWWLICLGTFIMILLGKEIYGGLGNNPFNGVLIAWVVLQMSFPDYMVEWFFAGELLSESPPLEVLSFEGAESIPEYFTTMDLFVGKTAGYIGEVSVLALLVGGVYLIARKVIRWHIPVSFMVGVAFVASICWLVDSETYAGPMFHLLAGGVFLAAFFIATDMPSSPVTPRGMLIFGFLCGVLTMVIRLWGKWDDGAYYAVFLISILTPLLDKIELKIYGR